MKARKGRPTQRQCKLDEGETTSREQAMGTSEKKSSHPAPPDDGGRNHRTVYSVPDPIINSEDEKDMEEEEGEEEECDEEDEESEENESDSSWNDSQSIVQSAALNLLYLSASWASQSEDQSEKLRETPTPINRKNTRRPRNTRNKSKRETRSTRNAKATTIIEKRNNEVKEMEEQVTNCELKKRKYNKKKNKNKETGNSDSSMEEGTQCSRVNGRGWRCKRMAVAGFALCSHHQGKGRLQNKRRANNINGVEDASTKRRDATKRKRSRST